MRKAKCSLGDETAIQQALERTRHERASFVSCVGEPLKRSVGRCLLSKGQFTEKLCDFLVSLVFLLWCLAFSL
jgi:hypothetical protein